MNRKVNLMPEDIKKAYAIELLIAKKKELGDDMLPKKSDFTEQEVSLIKQKLGPWPRALEAAGLKEKKAVSSKEKNRIKRERIRKAKKDESKI